MSKNRQWSRLEWSVDTQASLVEDLVTQTKGEEMTEITYWMGRRVDELSKEELLEAFHELAELYQSASKDMMDVHRHRAKEIAQQNVLPWIWS